MLVYFSVILKRLLNFVFSHLLCAKQKRKELLRSADAELNTEIKHTTSRRDGDDRECRGRRKHVLGKLPALALDDVEVHNVLVRVVVIVRARGARGADGRRHEADDEALAAVQAVSVVDPRAPGRVGRAARALLRARELARVQPLREGGARGAGCRRLQRPQDARGDLRRAAGWLPRRPRVECPLL